MEVWAQDRGKRFLCYGMTSSALAIVNNTTSPGGSLYDSMIITYTPPDMEVMSTRVPKKKEVGGDSA